jgi:DNA-directed RNA polymerase sigma subunit (sigma70/sigma32)
LRERIKARSGDIRLYQIVNRRFGLDGKPSETLQAIGQDLGISGERVRQLEKKAIRIYKNRQGSETGIVRLTL